MRFFALIPAVAAVLLLCSCADPVVFSEVFQQSLDQKIYTKYNIWYDNPNEIDSRNIQNGSYIPVGTEIEPVSTNSFRNEIVFKTVPDGKSYTIKFSSGHRLCTMREFVSYTFTTQPLPELLKDIPPAVQERIRRGEVIPGMDIKSVLLAYGPPPACRTSDLRNESWIYWRSPSNTVRIVLRKDKVVSILNVGQEI